MVKVLYFASAQGLANLKSEGLELADGSTVKDAASEVLRLHPALKGIAPTVRYSVNFVLSEDNARLKEGDEIAVLPPVAGG